MFKLLLEMLLDLIAAKICGISEHLHEQETRRLDSSEKCFDQDKGKTMKDLNSRESMALPVSFLLEPIITPKWAQFFFFWFCFFFKKNMNNALRFV
jgi:hypothetical protein